MLFRSTGVLNLSIGSTGVKKNRGAHMSYMSLARAAGLSSSFGFPTSRRRRSLRARARRSTLPLPLVCAAAVRPCHRRTPRHLHAPVIAAPRRPRARSALPARLTTADANCAAAFILAGARPRKHAHAFHAAHATTAPRNRTPRSIAIHTTHASYSTNCPSRFCVASRLP